MSPRSFARRFKATTGTTPHAWLLGQRLAAAEALLEESDAPVEEIARLVGFGTAAGLREQFGRRRGVSPRAYRQTFRAGSARGAAPVQLDGHRAGAGGVAARPVPGRGGVRSAGVARRRRPRRAGRSAPGRRSPPAARATTCATGEPVHHQCRSCPPGPQPRRSNSPMLVTSTVVPSGRSTCSCSRRTGSCQQTSGFVVSGCTPVRSAIRCRAQPMPPGCPGRLRKTQAPSTVRVRSERTPGSRRRPRRPPRSTSRARPAASCQSSSVSRATFAVTRARSSSSVKNAPWLQQPSSGRPSTTPAQPRP